MRNWGGSRGSIARLPMGRAGLFDVARQGMFIRSILTGRSEAGVLLFDFAALVVWRALSERCGVGACAPSLVRGDTLKTDLVFAPFMQN
jgi:hypothetical protein